MLKKLVNEARFRLIITTTGPLLIKSGYATILGPDMTPVLTFRKDQSGAFTQQVFMPGSSLKGVFRSHLEKIICSIKPQVVCDPFWRPNERNEERQDIQNLDIRERDYRISCGDKFNKLQKDFEEQQKQRRINNQPPLDQSKNPAARTDIIYHDSCPACRLFGSTSFIGRVSIGDAYLVDPEKIRTERRDGVGIDRLTGGASHTAKFELEVVSQGVEFATTIYLRNYEAWQLGMVFLVVQDMEDELIRIGSGRSRGLGMISAHIDTQEHDGHSGGVTTSVIRNPKHQESSKELWGMGKWLALDNDTSYGTFADDFLTLSIPCETEMRGVRNSRVFTGDALRSLQNSAIAQFVTRMQNWVSQAAPVEV
jgi:CRISPR-associated RAMP protein (TIGR02581 family)